MSVPDGRWHLVANGFQGDLTIVVKADGRVAGAVRIDLPAVDPIVGTWNETAQMIEFCRDVTVAGGTPQNYLGFLFEMDGPLASEGVYGPPIDPKFRVLTGSFDGTGTGRTRPRYGWIAWQPVQPDRASWDGPAG